MGIDTYSQILGSFLDSPNIVKLNEDIEKIRSCYHAENTDEVIEILTEILPINEGFGSLPEISPSDTISLIELIYKVQEACKKLWLVNKTDLQLTELVLIETKKYLKIPDIESYDPLNLLLVNVARALLIDS